MKQEALSKVDLLSGDFTQSLELSAAYKQLLFHNTVVFAISCLNTAWADR